MLEETKSVMKSEEIANNLTANVAKTEVQVDLSELCDEEMYQAAGGGVELYGFCPEGMYCSQMS